MISIIIPIYNAEKWLKECLESIFQQSYKDFEVLMVDDGSKDGSKSICREFTEKDRRFLYFYQDNAGVSVARNTGLSHSKGEWISFVDSDDMVDPFYLDEMLKHSEHADAIWCGFSTGLAGLGRREKVFSLSKEKLIRNIILERGKTPQLWSLLYRRKIIEKNNLMFTPGCVRNEDYEFFIKYLSFCEKQIVWNGYVGYFYRQNPQSVMHQRRSLQSVLMSIEASNRVGKELEQRGLIMDNTLLTAFAVTGFLFVMSKEKNIEIYNLLHSHYQVNKCVRKSLRAGGLRTKGAALLYIVLGRKVFYNVFSSF